MELRPNRLVIAFLLDVVTDLWLQRGKRNSKVCVLIRGGLGGGMIAQNIFTEDRLFVLLLTNAVAHQMMQRRLNISRHFNVPDSTVRVGAAIGQ